VAQRPCGHAQLDDPYGVALDLDRTVVVQQRQHVVTDRQRAIVARRYQAQGHADLAARSARVLPDTAMRVLSGPCA
jgi:hypothetical protein